VLLAVEAGVDRAPVREVMSPAVIAVKPGAAAFQAAVVMIRCMVRRVFVVDEAGNPVGVVSSRGEVVSEWQVVPPTTPDEVCYHMTRRFAVATPEADVHELLHRLKRVEDPYLVVLDRQRRPRGIVCALDVLAAQAEGVGAGGGSVPADRRRG
jgi:CBS-domain-containing membrane protein